MSTTATIDKTPAGIGRRRGSVASALASNAIEGQTFGSAEMEIVHRYVEGEIDNKTMREELLALPLE